MSSSDVVAEDGGRLRDARETDRLGGYLRALAGRREYAFYVASSELKSRQINSVLGNLWHLLNPLLQIAIFWIFFGLILDATRGVDNFIAYLAVGIFTYTFATKVITSGAKSLPKYRGLIQTITFPRALLPITASLTESLAIIPAYAVMFVVAFSTGEPLSAWWLVVVPIFVMQALFATGLALLAARAASHLPDVQQILPYVFRLGFYASGVLFNVNAYLEGNRAKVLFELNPFYCFIEINRGLLMSGHEAPGRLYLIALVWTVVAAVGGLLWFRRAEDTYGSGA